MGKNISNLIKGTGSVKGSKTQIRFYTSSGVIDSAYLIKFRRDVRHAHEELVAGRIRAYYTVQNERERRALNYQ